MEWVQSGYSAVGTEWVWSGYGAGTEHVWSGYSAVGMEWIQSMYGVGTEHVWVRSEYRVGMMQVLITIIQYHEIL